MPAAHTFSRCVSRAECLRARVVLRRAIDDAAAPGARDDRRRSADVAMSTAKRPLVACPMPHWGAHCLQCAAPEQRAIRVRNRVQRRSGRVRCGPQAILASLSLHITGYNSARDRTPAPRQLSRRWRHRTQAHYELNRSTTKKRPIGPTHCLPA